MLSSVGPNGQASMPVSAARTCPKPWAPAMWAQPHRFPAQLLLGHQLRAVPFETPEAPDAQFFKHSKIEWNQTIRKFRTGLYPDFTMVYCLFPFKTAGGGWFSHSPWPPPQLDPPQGASTSSDAKHMALVGQNDDSQTFIWVNHVYIYIYAYWYIYNIYIYII